MSKQGEAWIGSGQKRALEIALISPLLPATGGLAIADKFRQTIYPAPRSLYPGDRFLTKKLGDPDHDTTMLRLFRRAMIDELPQVLDIVDGSMTLIGPRADEPAHIDQLFDAIGDPDLHDRWQEARSSQKPGIISSYATHSHRHNLEGVSENARFSEAEALVENAHLRAALDIADFEAASMSHDMQLIGATAHMAAANYMHYVRNFLAPQVQTSEI